MEDDPPHRLRHKVKGVAPPPAIPPPPLSPTRPVAVAPRLIVRRRRPVAKTPSTRGVQPPPIAAATTSRAWRRLPPSTVRQERHRRQAQRLPLPSLPRRHRQDAATKGLETPLLQDTVRRCRRRRRHTPRDAVAARGTNPPPIAAVTRLRAWRHRPQCHRRPCCQYAPSPLPQG